MIPCLLSLLFGLRAMCVEADRLSQLVSPDMGHGSCMWPRELYVRSFSLVLSLQSLQSSAQLRLRFSPPLQQYAFCPLPPPGMPTAGSSSLISFLFLFFFSIFMFSRGSTFSVRRTPGITAVVRLRSQVDPALTERPRRSGCRRNSASRQRARVIGGIGRNFRLRDCINGKVGLPNLERIRHSTRGRSGGRSQATRSGRIFLLNRNLGNTIVDETIFECR